MNSIFLNPSKSKVWIIPITLLLFVVSGCSTFRVSNQEYQQKFEDIGIEVAIQTDTFKKRSYRFLHLHNNDTLPTLVFIHGAPGSSVIFFDYVKEKQFNSSYNILVVDRLGYGYSDYGNVTTIKNQARLIQHLVEKLDLHNTVLIGRSFGGPIAALASIYLGDRTSGTIMIAPAIDPAHERYIPGGRLAYWKSTRWIFSKAWQVSADEKYSHAEQLKELKKEWKKIKTPVLHIHGKKDRLAPFKNLEFTKKHFPKELLSTAVIEDGHHLETISLSKIKIIKTFIKKLPNRPRWNIQTMLKDDPTDLLD